MLKLVISVGQARLAFPNWYFCCPAALIVPRFVIAPPSQAPAAYLFQQRPSWLEAEQPEIRCICISDHKILIDISKTTSLNVLRLQESP